MKESELPQEVMRLLPRNVPAQAGLTPGWIAVKWIKVSDRHFDDMMFIVFALYTDHFSLKQSYLSQLHPIRTCYPLSPSAVHHSAEFFGVCCFCHTVIDVLSLDESFNCAYSIGSVLMWAGYSRECTFSISMLGFPARECYGSEGMK